MYFDMQEARTTKNTHTHIQYFEWKTIFVCDFLLVDIVILDIVYLCTIDCIVSLIFAFV